jgi:hypothetical protein
MGKPTVEEVTWDDGTKVLSVNFGDFIVRYYPKTHSLDVDLMMADGVDAWEVVRGDSGGFGVEPRDPKLSDLPFIRFPGDELWE